MEIVQVEDWEADFRGRIKYKREYFETQIIATNIEDIQLRIIKDDCGDYNVFYVSIESIANPDLIVGAVELIEKNYLDSTLKKVFEPHSFMSKEYRGKGYVEGVYRWILNNGFTLVSGERQTVCSDGLWKKLSNDFQLSYYDIFCAEFLDENDENFDIRYSDLRKVLKCK